MENSEAMKEHLRCSSCVVQKPVSSLVPKSTRQSDSKEPRRSNVRAHRETPSSLEIDRAAFPAKLNQRHNATAIPNLRQGARIPLNRSCTHEKSLHPCHCHYSGLSDVRCGSEKGTKTPLLLWSSLQGNYGHP